MRDTCPTSWEEAHGEFHCQPDYLARICRFRPRCYRRPGPCFRRAIVRIDGPVLRGNSTSQTSVSVSERYPPTTQARVTSCRFFPHAESLREFDGRLLHGFGQNTAAFRRDAGLQSSSDAAASSRDAAPKSSSGAAGPSRRDLAESSTRNSSCRRDDVPYLRTVIVAR